MMSKKTLCLIMALALCLGLSGCRTRTSGDMQGAHGGVQGEKGTAAGDASGGPLDGASPEKADSGEEADESGDESGSKTKENPEASRKEYDESARAEIVPGTDRSVYGEGEGSGAYSDSEDAQNAAAKLSDAAEQTAEQTVAAEQADKTGVSDDAEAADSSYRYFSVLLQERMGSLFECQRLSVYWETEQDHVTIFKTSPEHELILSAGAYDVSARLLEENLRVDDGWVARKNPGVIVKCPAQTGAYTARARAAARTATARTRKTPPPS